MNFTLSTVRSARFSNDAADTNVALSIVGDIIRLQPNLVRRWKSVIFLGWFVLTVDG